MRNTIKWFMTPSASVLLFLATLSSCFTADDVYFAINWANPEQSLLSPPTQDEKSAAEPEKSSSGIYMTSADNERYFCELPDEDSLGEDADADHYEGPDEDALLKPLMKPDSCSIR